MMKLKHLTVAAAATLIAGGAFIASIPSADAQMRGLGGGAGLRAGGFGGGGGAWRGGGFRGGGWGYRGGGWRGGGWGYRGGWRGGWGGGWGGAAAAGIIGGLALGAIAAGPAYADPYYGGGYYPAGTIPAYSWRNGYAPAYYDGYEAPVRCWWQRQRVPVDRWTYQIRRVRVCR